MSEEQNRQESTPGAEQRQQTSTGPDLINELRQFGQQLESLFTAALNNERTRNAQQDVFRGMQEIGVQMQNAIKNVQDTPAFKSLEERGRKALEEARESQLIDRLQDTLVKGIQQINEQISGLAERIRNEATPATPSSAQSVPVEDTSDTPPPPPPTTPSTGETTRL